jgi:mannosyltransferase
MIREMTEELAAASPRLEAGLAPWGAGAIAERTYRAWIGASVLASLVLGAVTIGREPLRNDEVLTLMLAERSGGDWLSELPHRQNGLLFDVVLWPVVHLGATSAAVIRIPALLAVAGAVVLCAIVGSRLAGRRVGALAAFLFALHPAAVFFGQEVRPYGFVLLFSLLAVWALLRALERPSLWRFGAYVLSVAAVGYSHDFALITVAAHPALVVGHPNRAARRGFVLALGLPALLLIPLVVFAPPDWGSSALSWISPATPGRVAETIDLIMGGAALAIGGTVALLWALVSPTARARAGSLMASVPRTYAFLGLWLTLPTIVLYLISQHQPVLMPRYAVGSVPAFCLALAIALSLLRPRLAVVAAVVAAAWLLGQSVQDDVVVEKNDWPGVAGYIASTAAPGERVILFGDPLVAANALFYYEPRFGIGRGELVSAEEVDERLPAPFVLAGARTDGTELEQAVGGQQTVWIVVSGYISPPADQTLQRLRTECREELERAFRLVTVLRLQGCPT